MLRPRLSAYRPAASPAVATFSLLLIGTLGCSSEEVVERRAQPAQRTRIERIVIATGTVEPATEVEIRPRIAGIVEKIHVEEGNLVEPGQPLVEIERELLASQVREAEATRQAAEVELRFAKLALDRNSELHVTGASSDQAHDDARARYERAGAERARAQAVVDTLNTQLSYATVRSTMHGRVLEVSTEEGNAVSPVTSVTGGTLLLSLAGDKTLYLEGLVDENEIARVAIDQLARIRTEAFRDRIFQGRVREIAPIGRRIQNVTYFEVKVEITDAQAALLRPRMSGDAEIVTEVVEGAIVVSESALRYRGNEILVDLERKADAENPEDSVRVVEIGIIDGDQVQILKGLAEGERVILQ